MAMSAARWHTTSMSVSSERTDPASRTSPATTSIWSRTSSSTVVEPAPRAERVVLDQRPHAVALARRGPR